MIERPTSYVTIYCECSIAVARFVKKHHVTFESVDCEIWLVFMGSQTKTTVSEKKNHAALIATAHYLEFNSF